MALLLSLLPGTRLAAADAGPTAGVFRGTSLTEVESFEQWANHKTPYVVDWSARWTWNDISEPTWLLEHWQGSGRRLVLGVAMLPENGEGTMQQGAAGAYNARYRRLAEQLVAYGHEDAILRVGWEFNGNWYRWSAHDPDTFVAYWRQIVATMRAVPGAKFRFDWTVNNGFGQSTDAVRAWPGAQWVDYVGVDAYDQSWAQDTYPYPSNCDDRCRRERQERAWQDIHGGHRGLAFWSSFARSHGKPLSLPEWGVFERPDRHGGGDNPYYIEQMHRFITDPANNVAYHAYFEFDAPDGDHRLMTGQFPQAAERYRELFGAPAAPTPSPRAVVDSVRADVDADGTVSGAFTITTGSPTTFRYLQLMVRDAQGNGADSSGSTYDFLHTPGAVVDGTRTFEGSREALPPGSYTVQVAYSLDGSTWVETKPVVTMEVAGGEPPAPVDVQATALRRSATVTWRSLPWSGSSSTTSTTDGSAIGTSSTAAASEYVVTTWERDRVVRRDTVAAPATELTVDKLKARTPYVFTVRAVAGGTSSPESAPSNEVTPTP